MFYVSTVLQILVMHIYMHMHIQLYPTAFLYEYNLRSTIYVPGRGSGWSVRLPLDL
jgi:hypothetical protein